MKILLVLSVIISYNMIFAQTPKEAEAKLHYLNTIKNEDDQYVHFLRVNIDLYYIGAPVKNQFDVALEPILESLKKEYFTSRFILLYIQDFILGGKILTICFHDKPDKVFNVAIKSEDNVPAAILFFEENIQNKKALLEVYKKNKLAQCSRFAY